MNPVYRFLSNLGPRPAGVITALSGGSDSVALTLMASQACQALGIELVAVHVHHGLRDDAHIDANFCRALCDRHAIRFRQANVKVRVRNSVMHQARSQRYAAIAVEAAALGIRVALTGHHADDRAENAWLARMRGSASFTINALERFPRLGLAVGRPLLAASRDELRDWLGARGETWVEDPSNSDPKYARTRARTAGRARPPRLFSEPKITRIARTIVTTSAAFDSVEGAARALTRASLGAVLGKGSYQALIECSKGVAGPFAAKRGVFWSDDARIYLKRTLGPCSDSWPGTAEPLILRCGVFPWFGATLRVDQNRFDGATGVIAATHIQGWVPGLRDAKGRKVSEQLRAGGISKITRWRWPCVMAGRTCTALIGQRGLQDGATWWIGLQDNEVAWNL